MRKYRRLTYEDRVKIETLLPKSTRTEISLLLGVAKSTITREIRKHSASIYRAHPAQLCVNFMQSRRRKGKSKIKSNPALQEFIEDKLRKHWAPSQISKRLMIDYNNDPSMHVSHECIYHYIYSMPKGELKKCLIAGLRQKKAARKLPKKEQDIKVKIIDRVGIEQRPIEVQDRLIAGHWESDLIIGKEQQSAIATMVERASRYLLIAKLPSRKAADVRTAMSEVLNNLPEFMRLTITHDNGIEMAEHALLTKQCKIKVFFANPYSPWERGTNENTNMLIRDYFPKGTDFNKVTAERLLEVQNKINDRPRKVLDWLKPEEVFDELIINGTAGKIKINESIQW